MIANNFLSLPPLIALSMTCALLVFIVALKRNNLVSFCIFNTGMISSFIASFFIYHEDNLSIVSFRGLILFGIIIAFLLYYDKKAINKKEEQYILFLLSITGGGVMILSHHLMVSFLGFALLSIPLYALIAYNDEGFACESATKYLVLGGIATATILLGIIFVYSQTRTFFIKSSLVGNPDILLLGYVLILSGLAFKLSLAPFHVWVLDVFMGAPVPIMTYLLIISKGASIVFLFKIFWSVDISIQNQLFFFPKCLAVLSIIGGNLLALWQTNLKRLIASSSIANMGYIVLLILVDEKEGIFGFLIFLSCYFISSLLFCVILNALTDEEQDLKSLSYWSRTNPILTIGLIISLLSLIGTPLTAGLIGKLFILQTLALKELYSLMFFVILGSSLGIFAYLRVIMSLFGQGFSLITEGPITFIRPQSILIILLSFLVLILGLWPALLWKIIINI